MSDSGTSVEWEDVEHPGYDIEDLREQFRQRLWKNPPPPRSETDEILDRMGEDRTEFYRCLTRAAEIALIAAGAIDYSTREAVRWAGQGQLILSTNPPFRLVFAIPLPKEPLDA